jgi:hypothetical protein
MTFSGHPACSYFKGGAQTQWPPASSTPCIWICWVGCSCHVSEVRLCMNCSCQQAYCTPPSHNGCALQMEESDTPINSVMLRFRFLMEPKNVHSKTLQIKCICITQNVDSVLHCSPCVPDTSKYIHSCAEILLGKIIH